MAKHSVGVTGGNAKHLVNHTPISGIKLAGETPTKPVVGKIFKLAGAPKAQGDQKKSRKRG